MSNHGAIGAGRRLQEHRAGNGYVRRTKFLQHLQAVLGDDAPSERLISALERGERSNHGPATIRAVDHWYGLPGGTYAAWLEGRDAPTAPVVTAVVEGRVVQITDEPGLLDLFSRTKAWLREGRQILDELGQSVDGQDVVPRA